MLEIKKENVKGTTKCVILIRTHIKIIIMFKTGFIIHYITRVDLQRVVVDWNYKQWTLDTK